MLHRPNDLCAIVAALKVKANVVRFAGIKTACEVGLAFSRTLLLDPIEG